jgi:hypothetical protein
MPDVSSVAPAVVNRWIVFDVHKNSLVAGALPATGGTPEVSRLENTEKAIRRFIGRATRARWRSPTRPGPVAMRSTGCWARWGWPAT